MKASTLIWSWEGQEVQVGLDRLGVGPIVLLLPALSSISTRQEMRPLQERLASDFATVAIDWPGFGNEPHPPIPWQPAAYTTFLHYVLTHVATHPLATVAAGHAASYALSVAAASPNSAGMLCLIAPTWRGPLPTIMGGRRRVEWVSPPSELPSGQLLPAQRQPGHGSHDRRAATFTPPQTGSQENSSSKRWLSLPVQVHGTPRSASSRACSTQCPNHSSFIETVKGIKDHLVIYGAATPRRSKAEMETLASSPNVRSVSAARQTGRPPRVPTRSLKR